MPDKAYTEEYNRVSRALDELEGRITDMQEKMRSMTYPAGPLGNIAANVYGKIERLYVLIHTKREDISAQDMTAIAPLIVEIEKCHSELQAALKKLSELRLGGTAQDFASWLSDLVESISTDFSNFLASFGWIGNKYKQRLVSEQVSHTLETADLVKSQLSETTLKTEHSPAILSKPSDNAHKNLAADLYRAGANNEVTINATPLSSLKYEKTESFIKSVLLQDVKTDEHSKELMVEYLTAKFHQKGLLYPVTSAVVDAIARASNGTILQPKADTVHREVTIRTTLTGLIIKEHVRIGKIIVFAKDTNDEPLLNETISTDGINELTQKDADHPLIEAEGTIQIDFSSNPKYPILTVSENRMTYGNATLARSISAPSFAEQLGQAIDGGYLEDKAIQENLSHPGALSRIFSKAHIRISESETELLAKAASKGQQAFETTYFNRIKSIVDELFNKTTSRGQLLKRAIYPTQENLTDEQVSDILKSIMVQYKVEVTSHDPENLSLRDMLDTIPLFIQTVDDIKHAANPTEEHPSPIPDNAIALNTLHQTLKRKALNFYDGANDVFDAMSTLLPSEIEAINSLSKIPLNTLAEKGRLDEVKKTFESALTQLEAMEDEIDNLTEPYNIKTAIKENFDYAKTAAHDLLGLLKPPLTQQKIKDILHSGRPSEGGPSASDESTVKPGSKYSGG